MGPPSETATAAAATAAAAARAATAAAAAPAAAHAAPAAAATARAAATAAAATAAAPAAAAARATATAAATAAIDAVSLERFRSGRYEDDASPTHGIPLWHTDENPIAARWLALKPKIPPEWTFFIDWYDAHLTGRQLPIALIHRILEEVPVSAWEAGPDAALPLINAIYDEWRAKKVIAEQGYPYAATYVETIAKLDAEPLEPVDLEQVIKDIRSSLRRFKERCKKEGGGNNLGAQLLAEMEGVIDELRKAVSRHKSDPLRLHQSLQDNIGEIRNRAHAEGFDREPLVNRLLTELERHGAEICILAPSVQEHQVALAKTQVALAKREVVLRNAAICLAMSEDSTGLLLSMTRHAVLTILDENTPEEDRARAWLFMNRMPVRAALAKRVAEADGKVVKATKRDFLGWAGKRGQDIANVEKGIDAIQETVGEVGPWAPAAIEMVARALGGG
ncbi:MAG: hypothetical protein ACU0CI_09600 [Shimia sp.]